MNDSENLVGKIKSNKKVIGENLHVIAIIFLVAFIIIDIIIILYLINENDKFHAIYTDSSRKESIQIRDYLVSQDIEAFLNEIGQVVVSKENVDEAKLRVDKKFFPQNLAIENNNEHGNNNEHESDYVEKGSDATQIVLEVTELEKNVKESLEDHVAIKNAIVRIEDYNSVTYDVSVTVVLTIESGMELQLTEINTMVWLISNIVNGCKSENIILINSQTN